MPDTRTLPDGRLAQVIPADEAGEFCLSAAEGLLQHLEAQRMLTWRQVTAAAELARLYGIGGGARPWNRGGTVTRDEGDEAAARRQFDALLAEVPQRTRWPLTVLAMGEWMTERDPLPLWREGLTALADHLRLAKEEA